MYTERIKVVSELIRKRLNKYIKETPNSLLTQTPKNYRFEAWNEFGYPNKSFWIQKDEVMNFIDTYASKGAVRLIDVSANRDRVSKGLYHSAYGFKHIKAEMLPLYWLYVYLYGSSHRNILCEYRGLFDEVKIDMAHNISNLWVSSRNRGYEINKTLNCMCEFRNRFVKARAVREIDEVIKLMELEVKELLENYAIVHVDCGYDTAVMYDGDTPLFRVVEIDDGRYKKIVETVESTHS